MHTTRFAPSPTGRLHLGHAFAAFTAAAAAAAGDGRWLLRFEDLDPVRSRPEFDRAIEEDLAWLGLSWPKPVLRQSRRLDTYREALDELAGRGLTYPCFCTRREIAAEVARAVEAPQCDGTEVTPVYPGTCRALPAPERARRLARGEHYALRLDARAAAERAGPLSFAELGAHPGAARRLIPVDPDLLGDVVLARRDVPASYHLAVVVDDAFQGVSLVTRGHDLRPATHVQRLLQALLGLPEPLYAHHRLILDEAGAKLSKRKRPASLERLRALGVTPDQIRGQLGL